MSAKRSRDKRDDDEAGPSRRVRISEPDNKSDQRALMKRLREESRRAYLPKRKDDMMFQMQRQLVDEENYFPTDELTERERIQRDVNKKILKAAHAYDKAGEILKEHRYVFLFYLISFYACFITLSFLAIICQVKPRQ